MRAAIRRQKIFLAATFVVAAVLAVTVSLPLMAAEPVALNVGHVGHDHQIALYVAADEGQALEERYGVYLRPLKDREVYELVEGGRTVARIHMIKVGGGSGMPAAMERGDIEVGLGGLGPVAKFADRGAPLKVLAPLNNDGDSLVLHPDFSVDNWAAFVEAVKKSERPVRIGYKAPMAVAYMILTKALVEEGLSYGQDPLDGDGNPVKVITVNLQGAGNMLPALAARTVDGVVANEPTASILEHRGVGRKVADLATLPPSGKWEGHPCCIVAATEQALGEKREAVKVLLKAIMAGADIMIADPERAYAAEARWTKTPAAVGRRSIPAVSYVIAPGDEWLRGVDTWIGLMLSMERFDKNYKGKDASSIREHLLDLSLARELLSSMELQSTE